jgi:hypothetical protein
MYFNMLAFLFRNISSRAGLTRKASAEVVAPTASMHSMARRNFGICGFDSFRRRLNTFISKSLYRNKEQGTRNKVQGQKSNRCDI